MKTCPHCGASLPEDAAFCPSCAESVNVREELAMPKKPVRRRVLHVALAVLALCVVALVIWQYNRPKTYEDNGTGEVIYTDKDGTYQLAFAFPNDHYTPYSYRRQRVPEDDPMEYFYDMWIYVNHQDSGANAGGLFWQKVEDVSLVVEQPADAVRPIVCTDPVINDPDSGAMLQSNVNFTIDSPKENVWCVWTIRLKNGDTIRMRQEVLIELLPIYRYGPDDTPLATAADLQALVDTVTQEAETLATIYITLPAVTYDEEIVFKRQFVLTGTEENGVRTTFTAPLRFSSPNSAIYYLTDIDLLGSGDGIGISSSARIELDNCRLSGWKTGILGYGEGWIDVENSTVEHNGVGVQFNFDNNAAATVSTYCPCGNVLFEGNGTAVLLERVPVEQPLHFDGCTFSGNDVDIDNRANVNLDTTAAVFG